MIRQIVLGGVPLHAHVGSPLPEASDACAEWSRKLLPFSSEPTVDAWLVALHSPDEAALPLKFSSPSMAPRTMDDT